MIRSRRIRRFFRQLALRVLRPTLNWLFNRRTIARLRRRKHVLCIGDSNILVLRVVRLPGVWLHRFGLGGATASGLDNPKEYSLSSDEIVPRLSRARTWHQVLLMLGNVDCSFVLWHHAHERGVDVHNLLGEAVASYSALIRQTIEMGFERVIVVSAPLPTMGDGHRPPNPRGRIEANQLERTQLTLAFNAAVQERCRELGAVFVDVTTEQLDPATGVIKAHLVRDARANFHLEEEPYRELVTRKLSALDWQRS